jgi:hypothetical protein
VELRPGTVGMAAMDSEGRRFAQGNSRGNRSHLVERGLECNPYNWLAVADHTQKEALPAGVPLHLAADPLLDQMVDCGSSEESNAHMSFAGSYSYPGTVVHCLCRRSRQDQERLVLMEHWRQLRDTYLTLDEALVRHMSPGYDGYTCAKAVPQAFGHNIEQRWRVWSASLTKCLLVISSAEQSTWASIPCLLIVSPYVLANFGRRAPMLSYNS